MSKKYTITDRHFYEFTAKDDQEAEMVFGLYAEYGTRWLDMTFLGSKVTADWNPSLEPETPNEEED